MKKIAFSFICLSSLFFSAQAFADCIGWDGVPYECSGYENFYAN